MHATGNLRCIISSTARGVVQHNVCCTYCHVLSNMWAKRGGVYPNKCPVCFSLRIGWPVHEVDTVQCSALSVPKQQFDICAVGGSHGRRWQSGYSCWLCCSNSLHQVGASYRPSSLATRLFRLSQRVCHGRGGLLHRKLCTVKRAADGQLSY